jgi:hypothetical protein
VRALNPPCAIFPPGTHIHGKNFSNLVCNLKAPSLAEFDFKFERPYKSGRDPHVPVSYTFIKAPLKIEKFFT